MQETSMAMRSALVKNHKYYSNFILFLIVFLGFIPGLIFELYAPSLPHVADYFNQSETFIKNTTTAAMAGYSIGSLIFGILMDAADRKKVLIAALFFFSIISLMAGFTHSALELIFIRFFQGLFMASCTIGSRVLAIDYFSGERFIAVILYISIAYSCGLISAPFLGGYLQYFFGWQSNFYAYALITSVSLMLVLCMPDNKSRKVKKYPIKHFTKAFCQILNSKVFLASVSISSLIMIGLLVYPTVGVFVVQDVMGYSSLVYGSTALLIGVSYLLGYISNRLLLRFLTQNQLIFVGFLLTIIAISMQIILSLWISMALWLLVAPIALIHYGAAFIQGNVLSICLKLFPENAGVNTALQACLVMLCGAIGIFLISSISITNLRDISVIFLFLISFQILIYFLLMQGRIKNN